LEGWLYTQTTLPWKDDYTHTQHYLGRM